MAGYILKYSASVYNAKITRLDTLHGLLQTHLDALEGYKDQIKNFWDDDQSPQYITGIANQITKVKGAMDNIKMAIAEYQGVSDRMTQGGQLVDEAMGDAKDALETVSEVTGDVAGVVGTIAPLL